jgi:hypothetical protein
VNRRFDHLKGEAMIEEHNDKRAADIDDLVAAMDRADVALAVYLEAVGRSNDPVRAFLELRAAILRWCADPFVSQCFGAECVLATAAAVQAMTPTEFGGYIRALRHLARMTAVDKRVVA